MEIAFWTAKALARPFHALQRWWKNPGNACLAASNHLASGSEPSLPTTSQTTNVWANATEANVYHCVPNQIESQPCDVPSTLALPMHLRLPCSVAAHPAPIKNRRTSHCTATVKNRDTQKPQRPMRCSASKPEAGHFFIAGRMADVCAELDRLAAREAAH